MIALLTALASGPLRVVVAAPSDGEGNWAGGPSAIVSDGQVWLAYRLRRPADRGRGYANVLARSDDGLHFQTVATLPKERFGAASLERPALVRRPDGGWRMYISCSTAGSKHWWVEAVDAETPARLADGARCVVLPGDETEAWKDVVVKVGTDGWHMWACRHPLDGGDDQADRMSSWYAVSADGLSWTVVAEALALRPGGWDARGARVSDVLHRDGEWWALYDGRASAAENWHERTGLARGDAPSSLSPVGGPVPAEPGRALRYASAIPADGGYRVYVEAANEQGNHDLCVVDAPLN